MVEAHGIDERSEWRTFGDKARAQPRLRASGSTMLSTQRVLWLESGRLLCCPACCVVRLGGSSGV